MRTRIFEAASKVAYLTLATSLFVTSAAHAQDWINIGQGDWFDPANWSTAAVPAAADDANINNGGTALLDRGADVQNFNVGVDGGTGSIRLESVGTRNLRGQNIRIGVTEAGAAPSTGVVRLVSPTFFGSPPPNTPVPFRLGYSGADGDANGQVLGEEDGNLGFDSTVRELQWGVAEGAGNASATITVSRVSTIGSRDLLEAGVSRGPGNALASVDSGGFTVTVRDLNVGVATGEGRAEGRLSGSGGFNPNNVTGDARVGVSDGDGNATGVVDVRSRQVSGSQNFGSFLQLDIGVSNGDGNASGTVLTSSGLRASTLNLGVRNGSGTAEGLIRTDRWVSVFDTMNLGPGATVLLNAGSNVRGGDSNDPSAYGAIDVTNTAALDGTLVVDFDYIPDGPTRFELIRSTTPNGLTGDFQTVEVRNLNPGLAWTSGIELDGGVEKYVLEVTGTPVFPEWTDPGSDNWFDASNWSNATVPDASQPAFIQNGGEARANSATAPGPLQAFEFGIGVDGGSGALVVDGVDLEPTTSLQIGLIQQDHTSGGLASGRLEWSDGTLRFPAGAENDPPPDQPTGRTINIGAAYTTGEARGRLVLDSVDISDNGSLDALNALPIRVGFVRLESSETGAAATAEGELTVTGNTALPSDSEIVAALVDVEAEGASASVSAILNLRNNSFNQGFNIGDVDVRITGATNSTGRAEATVSFVDVAFEGALDLAHVEVDQEDSTGQSNVTAIFERVTIQSDRFIRPAHCDAESSNARVLPGFADLTVIDSSLTFSVLDLSEVETDADGVAECTSRVQISDSELIGEALLVAEGEADDNARATANAELTVTGGSVVAERARIGEADPDEDGVAIVDARLSLQNTTATFSQDVIVGFYDDDGAAQGNTITARLGLTSSSLDTPLLEIGVENPANHPLDAELSLNPSYLRTDDLQLGPTSRIVLTAEGTTRASPTNLGQPGLYAAIDAGTAQIDGEIIVEIAYSGRTGDVLDVLSTDPGGLTGSNPQISFIGAPASAAELETVTENGRDILRLTVLEDIIFQPDTETTPQAIPINQPLALLLIMLGLSVLGAAALRRG